jgi:hypothetical protein
MFSSSETMYEQKENKKDKNIEEWNRINNIWLDIRNKNKTENPCLYSTDSDNSVDNTPPTSCSANLKKSNSFCSYDDEISIENSICNGIMDTRYDGIDDTYDTYEYTHHSIVTPNSIKYKYTIENTASLELDYSLNYNMKMLTHIGNYYEILKSKYGQGKPKTRNVAIKMCKPELIKSIVAFETDAMNHRVVYQCKKMLENIEAIKGDKYFASFVIFP